MSTTTTTDTTRYAVHSYLADYELHHSDHPSTSAPRPNSHPDPRQLGSSASPHTTAELVQLNPPQWPSNHRRIPPYRPINRALDQSQRKVFLSTGERIFLFVMFTGLQVNVDINRLWNATGGRLAQSVFQYKIGGEW
ncbi:hypothetical protein BU16DRAFT_453388 [Lophium mytilinum]|uniref:Uncharacterized protein n=1 Tax=Lophium mytilinum TaxID=390894 RepID=A0A6A6RAZ4_9PEZI|nr:hypothetical protein BU16DRAFT_453388 [Lophium mytilinum]